MRTLRQIWNDLKLGHQLHYPYFVPPSGGVRVPRLWKRLRRSMGRRGGVLWAAIDDAMVAYLFPRKLRA